MSYKEQHVYKRINKKASDQKMMIWYRDIWGFMTVEQLGIFFPSREMTLEQQLNSVLRFAIYFALAIVALKGSMSVIYVALITALFTFLIYESEVLGKNNKKDLFQAMNVAETSNPRKRHIYKPTKDNPFMNVMVSDYEKFPSRPPAGDWSDPTVKKQINCQFNNGFKRSERDAFSKSASDRQYYTMPSTTIPNNQDAYANWLFSNPKKTYKEDGLFMNKF